MSEMKKWGDIARLTYGRALQDYDHHTPGPVRVFGTNGPIGYTSKSQAAGPNVIIGRKGAYRGVHFSPGPFWVIDTAYYLEHDRDVHPRWAYYSLKASNIQGLSSGSAIPSTTREDFYTLPVLIPDVLTQEAIADILGSFDDKIDANDRIAQKSLELARAKFDQQLDSTPKNYATLADLCAKGWLQISDGYRTKRSEHGRPGIRILRAGDVDADTIAPSGRDFVSEHFRGVMGNKISQPGDIVMTTKGSVGRVGVIRDNLEQLVYSPQLCYFRVVNSGSLLPSFLAGWFRSPDVQRQAKLRMFKTDMAPYINLKDIYSMSIPVIAPADQRRIGEVQSALDNVAYGAKRENQVLARIRDELLPLLMSGKVSVKDAKRLIEEVL